jgi:hypothetical protein
MSRKPLYLSLSKPVERLSALRAKGAKVGKDWREARDYGAHNWAASYGELSEGYNEEHGTRVPLWTTFTGPKFRDEKFCDESDAYRVTHTGWFTNDDCDEKARGIIGRLSHNRFVAGYEFSMNGERVYFADVYSEERDAVISADHHAERFADIEREYNARWRAARALEDKNESAFQRLRECLALRNNACFASLRDEARELMETIRANRLTLATDYKDVE